MNLLTTRFGFLDFITAELFKQDNWNNEHQSRDETTTTSIQNNSDDKLLILDGRQRLAYFTTFDLNERVSLSGFFNRLNK